MTKRFYSWDPAPPFSPSDFCGIFCWERRCCFKLLIVPLSHLPCWSPRPPARGSGVGESSLLNAVRRGCPPSCGKAILFHQDAALGGEPLKEWEKLETVLLGRSDQSLHPSGPVGWWRFQPVPLTSRMAFMATLRSRICILKKKSIKQSC